MSPAPPVGDEARIDLILGTTPLEFVREYLRTVRKENNAVRIGTTRAEVRENLRTALVSGALDRSALEAWFEATEGWGKQHLYLSTTTYRGLHHRHLLTRGALVTFMRSRGLHADVPAEPTSAHVLTEVFVDDELVRLTWRLHKMDFLRREDLDREEDNEDGRFQFRAYRFTPRRSSSRLILRKTDGVVLLLIDLPTGEDHSALRGTIEGVAQALLHPTVPNVVHVAPIVSALDSDGLAATGPRPRRTAGIAVTPTQARYRADGAELEFRSTKQASGYAESPPVAHVRRAMTLARFEGASGRFRLTFTGHGGKKRSMVISLNAHENSLYLFSSMIEAEVLDLAEQLLERTRGR